MTKRKAEKGRKKGGREGILPSPLGTDPLPEPYVAVLAREGLVLGSRGPAPLTGGSPEGLLPG